MDDYCDGGTVDVMPDTSESLDFGSDVSDTTEENFDFSDDGSDNLTDGVEENCETSDTEEAVDFSDDLDNETDGCLDYQEPETLKTDDQTEDFSFDEDDLPEGDVENDCLENADDVGVENPDEFKFDDDVATSGNEFGENPNQKTYSNDELGQAVQAADEAFQKLHNYRVENDLGMSMEPSPEEQELIDNYMQANDNYQGLKKTAGLENAKKEAELFEMGVNNANDANENNLPNDDFSEQKENQPNIEYGEADKTKDISDKQFDKLSKNDAQDLDYFTKQPFENYCGDGYQKINPYLRGKEMNLAPESEKLIQNDINKMTDVLNQKELPRDMNLYRGLNSPQAIFGDGYKDKSIEQLNNEFVGKVFVEPSFCSTTTDKNTANTFANSWDGTVLEISAPQGANGMCMGEVSPYSSENEVLLQRGSAFRIDSISQGDRGAYRVNTTLIGRN